jgi:hypothetical protein
VSLGRLSMVRRNQESAIPFVTEIAIVPVPWPDTRSDVMRPVSRSPSLFGEARTPQTGSQAGSGVVMNSKGSPAPLGALARVICAVTVSTLAAGCADLPKSMRVGDGGAPKHVDDDVRFRTTYFFRVFDYCYDVKAAQKSMPVADSLYRFVMTGKANPYSTSVKFESGTLTAAQIDPFGATVEADEKTGAIRYVSQREAQARAARKETTSSIDALIELRGRLRQLEKDDPKSIDGTVIAALDAQIKAAITGGLGIGRIEYDETRLHQAGKLPDQDLCPPGTQIDRGFQIMGPQGVRTFNQDERLLMAMSTQATGVLDSLSQVSGRLLETKGSKLRDSNALLALIRERLRVSELRRIADGAGTPTKREELDATIGQLADRLESGTGAAP